MTFCPTRFGQGDRFANAKLRVFSSDKSQWHHLCFVAKDGFLPRRQISLIEVEACMIQYCHAPLVERRSWKDRPTPRSRHAFNTFPITAVCWNRTPLLVRISRNHRSCYSIVQNCTHNKRILFSVCNTGLTADPGRPTAALSIAVVHGANVTKPAAQVASRGTGV